LLPHSLISVNRVPVEGLTVFWVVKKLPTFYSIWFITNLTKAIVWSLYWAIWHESMVSHSLSITFLHQDLNAYSSPLCTTILFFPMFARGPSNLIHLNLITRWEDNIKMDLQEVGGGCGDWMELAQDRDRWQALVSMVMNLRVPKMWGISWLAAEPVSFSRRTLLHRVSK